MATLTTKRYDSGKKEITPKSLLNNEQGITLLMRDYEEVAKEIEELKKQNQEIIENSSQMRTSASYNIFTILFNLLGTITIGIGVNLVTAKTSEWKYYAVLFLGAFIYFISALMVLRTDKIVTRWNKLVEKYAVE